MNFKKISVIILGLGLLSFGVTIAFLRTDHFLTDKKPQVAYMNSEAKIDGVADFKELDDRAEIIVKGTKTKVLNNVINKDAEGMVIDYHTDSEVQIDQVYKGESSGISENKQLLVRENGAVDQVGETTVFYGVEGYQLMNEDEEYLLFLSPSLTDANVYFIEGVYYGKVPVDADQNLGKSATSSNLSTLEYRDEDSAKPEKLNQIFAEALQKYNP